MHLRHSSTARSPSPVGRTFAIVAFVEASTWAGLLVGMFLKYVTETTEMGVTIFGALHGGAFLVYVAATVVAARVLRWPWQVALAGLAAGVPPLATLPFEWWVRRAGLLATALQREPTLAVRQ